MGISLLCDAAHSAEKAEKYESAADLRLQFVLTELTRALVELNPE
jgi:hypothetical protein